MSDPRVERSRQAVLSATVELLRESGVERLTIEAVADRSGVAKTTIYRHWTGKAELVTDAIDSLVPEVPDPDTGSLAGDLALLARGLAAGLAKGPWAEVMPSLIAAAARDPELRRLHRAATRRRHRAVVRAVDRAKQRGEAPDELDADTLIADIAGPLFYKALVEGRPLSMAAAERLARRAVTRWLSEFATLP